MQNNKRVYLVLAIFLLVLPFTMAVGGISILDTYQEYYGWVDFALYLLIFVGITQELMKLKFKKGAFSGLGGGGELSQGAKAVSIGLGLALAISLATWEVRSGFSLYQLGPFILLIIALLILLGIAGWLKSRDKTGLGLGELRNAAIYLIIFLLILYFFFPGLIYAYLPWSWINNLFWLLIIIAIIIFLISLGKHGESTESSGKGLLEKAWDGTKWLGRKGLDAAKYAGKGAYKGGKKVGGYALDKYKELLWVSIIPLPNWKVYSAPKRIWVKAGAPLDLFAKVEGGSKDYTVVWSVNNLDPKRVIHTETRNEIRIHIPTGDLKLGTYVWRVDVQDNERAQRKATDTIKVVITKNPELEKLQDKDIDKAGISDIQAGPPKEKLWKKALSGLWGATKWGAKKGGKGAAIAGKFGAKKGKELAVKGYEKGKKWWNKKLIITDLNGPLYGNNSHQYKGIYLLPLGKKIKLDSEKGGLIDKVEWWLCDADTGKLDKPIGNGETLKTTLTRNKFKEGVFSIKVIGYEKGINPDKDDPDRKKPTVVNEKNVYLKKSPNILTSFYNYKLDKDGKQLYNELKANEENNLEIDNRYGVKIEVEEEKDKLIKNKIEIKDYNKKGHKYEVKDKNHLIEIFPQKTGKFDLDIDLIIRDNFNSIEELPIKRKINVMDLKQIQKDKIEEFKKIYDKKISKPIFVKIGNRIIEEMGRGKLIDFLILNLSGTGYAEEIYEKKIQNPINEIIKYEEEINKLLKDDLNEIVNDCEKRGFGSIKQYNELKVVIEELKNSIGLLEKELKVKRMLVNKIDDTYHITDLDKLEEKRKRIESICMNRKNIWNKFFDLDKNILSL